MAGAATLLFCVHVHSCVALVINHQNNGAHQPQAHRIISPDEFLRIGNQLYGYSQRQITKAKRKDNVDNFKNAHGSSHCHDRSIDRSSIVGVW